MTSTRRLTALLLLIASMVPLSLRHGHPMGEVDLIGHDHQAGATMVVSVEDCGSARHLHPTEEHAHPACEACLAQCFRLAEVNPDETPGPRLLDLGVAPGTRTDRPIVNRPARIDSRGPPSPSFV